MPISRLLVLLMLLMLASPSGAQPINPATDPSEVPPVPPQPRSVQTLPIPHENSEIRITTDDRLIKTRDTNHVRLVQQSDGKLVLVPVEATKQAVP